MVPLCVVGSLNMDLVVRIPRLPRIGETVSGGTFATFPGGKGANQAVAAARLGARVTMVGRAGADPFGRRLVEGLTQDGVDVSRVRLDPDAPTGMAFIAVDRDGRNMIMVAPGANTRVLAADVDEAGEAVTGARVVLLQLEVPMDAVVHAAALARGAGALVCLNPAPAATLPDALYASVDVITPNEVEAQFLTAVTIRSVADAERAAGMLRVRGPRVVVITLGDRGAVYVGPEGDGHVPALPLTAVDTTAAGDAFAAALGVALAEGQSVPDAVAFATRAAGIKVTRMGAQTGMPARAEVEGLIN